MTLPTATTQLWKLQLVGILVLLAAQSTVRSSAFRAFGPLACEKRIFRQNLTAPTAVRWPVRAETPRQRAPLETSARRSVLVRLLSCTCLTRYPLRQTSSVGSAGLGLQGSSSVKGVRTAVKMPVVLSPGDTIGGEGLHWCPSKATGTLIFMHGLGDTAGGWTELLQLFEAAQIHEKARLILPTAPTRPVTLNMGVRMTAWSDIRGLSADSSEDKDGLMASKARIDRIIDSEIKAGIHPSRILVGGFSQGGALAYLVGLTSPHKLGGILSLSSWCPLGKEIQVSPHYAQAVPRILHCHGAVDDIVRPIYGQTSVESVRNRLIDSGARPEKCQDDITFKLYEGLGHSANQQELNDIKVFLSRIFNAK